MEILNEYVKGFQNPHKVTILPYQVCKGLLDLMALLQEEAREKCIGVHHKVQKEDHNGRHLPKEPICSP